VFSGHVLSRIPLAPLRWRVRESAVFVSEGPARVVEAFEGMCDVLHGALALVEAVRPNPWDDVDKKKKSRSRVPRPNARHSVREPPQHSAVLELQMGRRDSEAARCNAAYARS
jgi:hypothetical protein